MSIGTLKPRVTGMILCVLCAIPGIWAQDPVESATVFNIRDFGGVGDGKTDDAPAFNCTLAAAARRSNPTRPCQILLPAGTYRLSTAFDKNQMLSIAGLQNATIQGDDTTLLLITNPERGLLELVKGVNVQIRNLAVDYDPLTFAQLRVVGAGTTAANARVFEVELMPGYPALELPHLRGESVIGYGADGKLNREAPLLKIQKTTRLADGRYQIQLGGWQGKPEFVNPGDMLVRNGRHVGKSVFKFVRCTSPVLENVRVFAGPEVFLLAVETDGLRVCNSRIAPPENSGRLLSTSADGIFSVGGRVGPVVENCVFSGNGDDNINIHHTAGFVYGFNAAGDLIATETPWTAASNGEYQGLWQVGDPLEIVNKQFETVFRAEIAALYPQMKLGRYAVRVQFRKGGKDERIDPVFFASHPESEASATDLMVFNLNRCGGGFQIRNNQFLNHRGRGVLLQSRNGVVENNLFSDLDGGVYLTGEWHYKDGPLARDILIRGNRFQNLGRYICDAAISVSINGRNSRSNGFQRLVIEQNVFEKILNPAVSIENARDVLVRNNTIFAESGRELDAYVQIGKRGPVEQVQVRENSLRTTPAGCAQATMPVSVPAPEIFVK